MKVLYYALHDPKVLDLASSVDYFHYRAVYENGVEVKSFGPLNSPPLGLENLAARVFQRTGNRFVKYKMSVAWKESQALNQAVREWKPDVVLTMNMASMVFYKNEVPSVLSRDTTFYGQQEFWPVYGRLAQMINIWEEKRALRNSTRIITNSQWSKRVIAGFYKNSSEKIDVFVLPSALLSDVVPKSIDVKGWKKIEFPLRLLLVGRDSNPPRKGLSIAIEVVRQLNDSGIPAELTICGTPGQSDKYVKFVGPFKKSVKEQLNQYVDLYHHAHLLIHPAIFEAAGIAPSEAAAFGTPTITNDVGGLATTVADGESGIVLPKWSPPEAYVQAIARLIQDPEGYYALCRKTRERYERELNWDVSGKWLADVLHQTVENARKSR